MSTTDIIILLRSGEKEAVFSVAEEAADKLEMLEERLAIMGEVLTEKEWERTETEARRRIEKRGL